MAEMCSECLCTFDNIGYTRICLFSKCVKMLKMFESDTVCFGPRENFYGILDVSFAHFFS